MKKRKEMDSGLTHGFAHMLSGCTKGNGWCAEGKKRKKIKIKKEEKREDKYKNIGTLFLIFILLNQICKIKQQRE